MLEIFGPWRKGYAFDIYTIRSKFLGRDKYGLKRFKTTRSPMGECVYDLKYNQERSNIEKIINMLSASAEFTDFISSFDIILTVPPSNKTRRFQPVELIAKEIAKRFNKKRYKNVFSISGKKEVKSMDIIEKDEKLKKILKLNKQLDMTKKILIFDDVYDSGATLSAMTNIMLKKGFTRIYIFTLTKTKGMIG
jgi:predicted amidophosphoribosyltransferase